MYMYMYNVRTCILYMYVISVQVSSLVNSNTLTNTRTEKHSYICLHCTCICTHVYVRMLFTIKSSMLMFPCLLQTTSVYCGVWMAVAAMSEQGYGQVAHSPTGRGSPPLLRKGIPGERKPLREKLITYYEQIFQVRVQQVHCRTGSAYVHVCVDYRFIYVQCM